MVTFNELNATNQALIRKGLQVAVFIKPYALGDAAITALAGPSGLLAIPTGYEGVGLLTKDQGLNWTREMETNDTTSAGVSGPTRRDITSDVDGLQFTMQESKKTVIEVYEGRSLDGVTSDANGNVAWDKPDRPDNPFYRILTLAKDGEGADAFYFGSWLPKVQITDRAEQGWNEENEKQYGVTVTSYVDAAVGTAKRDMWVIPTGYRAAMGFASA